MWRRLRIAILLYVLAFVIVAQYLAGARSTDWEDALWINVHPVNGDGSPVTQTFIDTLRREDFEAIERFFAREARRYGVALERPVRIELDVARSVRVPTLGDSPSLLGAAVFSLQLRWLKLALEWRSDLPGADIMAVAVFHDATAGHSLDRSTGLRKGLVALAHLFAARSANGSNAVVLAHEIAHTLGATDKYDLSTGSPIFPDGYGDPDARPTHPQLRAELMGGRIAVDDRVAEVPASLEVVVVGRATAREIGWLKD